MVTQIVQKNPADFQPLEVARHNFKWLEVTISHLTALWHYTSINICRHLKLEIAIPASNEGKNKVTIKQDNA